MPGTSARLNSHPLRRDRLRAHCVVFAPQPGSFGHSDAWTVHGQCHGCNRVLRLVSEVVWLPQPQRNVPGTDRCGVAGLEEFCRLRTIECVDGR